MTASTTRALVRPPVADLAEGLVTHIDRTAVDVDLAIRQWHGYTAAMEASGWDLVVVPPAPECPDSVFVEDALVMFRNVAVVTRPGAMSRRGETRGVAAVAEDLGASMNRIVAPGTLDGGDVLKVGDTVYVGRGGRTNHEGIRQLRTIVEPLGFTVVVVPLSRVLHLKSAVTALPDGTVVGYPPLVDHVELFDRFLDVPEESGAHVVLLGGGKLLMAADAPRSAQLFTDLGYHPVLVDISEYQKLEGCVTCLSVRLRAVPVGRPAPREEP